jgi:hypothetical protein
MVRYTDETMQNPNGHWTPYIIEFKGIFDMEGLYRFIIKWLQDRSYEFHEVTYKHKPGMIGKEQEMKWKAWQKFNDYIRMWYDIYIHVWDMTELEVTKDGQKVKMIKGRIRIVIVGTLDQDWQQTFKTPDDPKVNDFIRRIRSFYDKYVVYKDMTGIWGDMMHYKIVKLHNEIKEFLGMECTSRAHYHYMGPDQSG